MTLFNEEGNSNMKEENKRIYEKAFAASGDIFGYGSNLLGDIGYWGSGGRGDEESLYEAERDLSRLKTAAERLEEALSLMKKVMRKANKEA